MDALIYCIFLFCILTPLVLSIIIPMFRKHYKTTDGIINYDIYMRKFVYKTALKRDDIIDTLSKQDDIEELNCRFDFECNTVVISEYGSHREYFFYIEEYDGFSILKLNQTSVFAMPSHVPFKLNPFIVSRLQAELVPFSQYSF